MPSQSPYTPERQVKPVRYMDAFTSSSSYIAEESLSR